MRTPLTSIQGFSQALLDGTADTPEQRSRSAAAIYRESTRLRRLVDALIREEVERLVQTGQAAPDRVEGGLMTRFRVDLPLVSGEAAQERRG